MLDTPEEPTAPVAVDVRRTGGFAGLTRQWSVTAGSDSATHWTALIDACPWPDAELTADTSLVDGADRFMWHVRAQHPLCDERQAVLPEDAVTGPWAALINAVRATEHENRAR
ncbi:protealysin inhibitor emfourin [Microbacterium sp. C7(2022)]|uniref:protealysin inhibitor emfourin n=1 Tax=Microbacterium sp. C7(2022) TaxID=2992759 RepID=UPI00237B38AC|nr:protealysin inhibitor emfourin [Microbacterium sp. C7(2022)]MDE0547259.1 hypothetical protein [Microbacterium sp. C7(2022)]